MHKFNPTFIIAWLFILYIYLFPPLLAPLTFILLLVSVLFWVLCEVASWLKASPGEIGFPYHTLPYCTIPYRTVPYHTIVNQLLGMVVILGWANEGLLYWDKVLAAIKFGSYFLLSDVYCFSSPSSCAVCLHLLHCVCFPVYLVLCLPCVYSNPVLYVIPLDCSFVLAQFFSNVLPVSPMYTHWHLAQGIWYITHLFFKAGCGSLVCTKASQSVPLDLKVVLIPSGLHACSILSLTHLM